MTRDEAIRMVKAKLECMTRDVSGRDSDCINRRCDECNLNYEQGNMGEQKEWLRMAIEALKEQKTGHWIHDGGYWKNRWICSECGYKLFDVQTKHCPDCGCQMESEVEE